MLFQSRSFHIVSTRLILAVTATLLVACSESTPPPETIPPSVTVIEVNTQDVGDYREFVARTEAFQTVNLRARVSGVITKRHFTEGGMVKKDQLLFEIDKANYEAAYNTALANLSGAKVERERTERDEKRGKDVFEKRFISQADMDALTSNAAQARASQQAAQAAVDNAKINLGYTSIYAPIDGHISTANYGAGNLVGPDSGALATLLNNDPIYVNFQLDEKAFTTHLEDITSKVKEDPEALNRIRQAYELSLVLPNGNTYAHTGKLNYTGIKVDEMTGTVNLRAEFPNPDRIIRPGLFVTLFLESKNKPSLPVVPQFALQEGQQGKFVLIVDSDNIVHSRNVEVGRNIGLLSVVNNGLTVGDYIIVEGLQKVRQGMVVNPNIKYFDSKSGALLDDSESIS